jgi:ribonuclease P protein component
MLKKSERVARSDFGAFFKKGRKVHGDHVFAVVSPYLTFHASVVVSKKVAKSAVERNTYRRRVYAQLLILKRRGFKGVVIITLKPTFSELTRIEAKAALEALIVRIEKSA